MKTRISEQAELAALLTLAAAKLKAEGKTAAYIDYLTNRIHGIADAAGFDPEDIWSNEVAEAAENTPGFSLEIDYDDPNRSLVHFPPAN